MSEVRSPLIPPYGPIRERFEQAKRDKIMEMGMERMRPQIEEWRRLAPGWLKTQMRFRLHPPELHNID